MLQRDLIKINYYVHSRILEKISSNELSRGFLGTRRLHLCQISSAQFQTEEDQRFRKQFSRNLNDDTSLLIQARIVHSAWTLSKVFNSGNLKNIFVPNKIN
jgi:hypothetical protein